MVLCARTAGFQACEYTVYICEYKGYIHEGSSTSTTPLMTGNATGCFREQLLYIFFAKTQGLKHTNC